MKIIVYSSDDSGNAVHKALEAAGASVTSLKALPLHLDCEILFVIGNWEFLQSVFFQVHKRAQNTNAVLWMVCLEGFNDNGGKPWMYPGVCFSSQLNVDQIVSFFRQKPVGKL